MRYVDYGAGGPPEVLKVEEGPRPVLRPGTVVIDVAYAGVNGPDVFQRQGSYPPPPGASPILGLEVSGHVAEVAPDVTGLHAGDAVCALVPGGGYADACLVAASNVLPIPAGMSLRDAAAIPETFFTVWTNVFERGRLASGETLLVHGGSSGIGTTAIQLAKAFGATVYVTVGSAEKAAFCARLGADAAIDYRTDDFVAGVQALTGKAGVDVILDMVGGPYIEKNLDLLALDGRLVQIAFREGSRVTLDLMRVMTKRLTITGSTLRPRTVEQKAAIASALRTHVWPLLASGAVKPIVHAEFPLADAAQAHALMESSAHLGKIVLAVDPR